MNPFQGSWKGNLMVQGIRLPLILHLENEDGAWKGKLDSPAQGASGIPLSSVDVKDYSVKWESSSIGASFSGELHGDSIVIGKFSQGGLSLPLQLSRHQEASENLRPQTPTPPFSYLQEQVSFESGSARISGTLSIPEGEGPFPAIILVAGSGPMNRDQEVFGHKPFAVISDFLTLKGWCVFRYDKRGIGESTGDLKFATTDSLAKDAYHAIEIVRRHSKVHSEKVGFLGHSEGSLVASMAAEMGVTPAFIVSMGGPAIRGDSLLLEQTEALAKSSGTSIDERIATRSLNAALYRSAASEKDDRQARWEMEAYISEWLLGFDDTLRVELGKQVKDQIPILLSAWFRRFMRIEPSEFWSKVTCPVLILQGDLDLQVVEENGYRLRGILRSSGNSNVSLSVLPDHNHLFQVAKTGLPDEYGQIQETVSVQTLNLIGNWLKGFRD
jgi:uncharacterized protein